jgi:hypothetical protein
MTTYRCTITLNEDEYTIVQAALEHFVAHCESATKEPDRLNSVGRKALAMLVISRLQKADQR